MKTFTEKTTPFLKVALMACTVGIVAGCAMQATPVDEKRMDVRTQHPIEVARQQVTITIDLPAEGFALPPADARRLHGFIRDFADRGRSAVMVESQMGDRAREILEAQGLRANEIILAPDATINAPAATLTFTANVAQVPACGDWSESMSFNPSNDTAPDFGCSNRRNIGLIVADPGDLIEAQPMSGRGAARRDAVLDSYNSGEPIGPRTKAMDTQAVSGTQSAK